MDDKNAIYQMRFPQKLWYLLNLRPDAIFWGGTGRTILLNYRILQNYLQCDHSVFKTTNISSFVRQLNLYGFRKVTSHLQDPLCNSSNPYMHEYVHDYFQFGRPELLNKITRKALTMKRSFKPKNTYNSVEQLLCMTPLQKARHALRMALKKAAQELFSQDSSKQLYNTPLEYDDSQDDVYEEEESFELDWMPQKNDNSSISLLPEVSVEPKNGDENIKSIVLKQTPEQQGKKEENESFGDENQDSLMSFTNDTCQENSDSFSTPFLSMPDLDAVPTDSQTGAELLAEFNIDNDIDEGITRKLRDDERGSLNCVLPSISQDQNDYTVMNEMPGTKIAKTIERLITGHKGKPCHCFCYPGTRNIITDHEEVWNNVNMDQYNGEWEQMFNDMINRSTNPECGSELKELYSQISKTIDLLNS